MLLYEQMLFLIDRLTHRFQSHQLRKNDRLSGYRPSQLSADYFQKGSPQLSAISLFRTNTAPPLCEKGNFRQQKDQL